MPKNKTLANESADVIQQAQAAANEPALTPLENQAIQELVQPTIDAIFNAQPEPTPKDQDQQHIDELDRQHIDDLAQAMAEIDQKIVVAKDHVSTLEAKKKEIKEQYLDAIKCKPALYKAKLQSSFGF